MQQTLLKDAGPAAQPTPTISALNPATGEHLLEVAMSTPSEISAARDELQRLFPIWSGKPLAERIRILRQFQSVIVDAVDEITDVINRDCGKTRQDALIELFITLDLLNEYLKKAPAWLADRNVPTGIYVMKHAYVEQRPYGVTAIIGPWNYPFVLTVSPLITALLAGNTVMLKPSEETTLVGQLIKDLLGRVPELNPFVRVLFGDGRVGAAMVAAKPDLIFLTGSTGTGQKVLTAAAEHLIPVISELGGKDALIVLEDADLEAAAHWAVWGACFNAGQTCMAVERVYVVESVYDEFVRHVVHYAQQFEMGYSNDIDARFSMGPLTTTRQVEIIDRQLQDAIDKGAKVLVGGQRRGQFMEPTVLVEVDSSMQLMQEETFGPLVPIMKVKDAQEAIAHANASEFGLGASVWSRDLDRAQAVLRQIQSGTLQANDVLSHFAVTQFPFGGVKKSGQGRIHGKEDLLQFTQSHAYLVSKPPAAFDIATILRKPGHYRLGRGLMKLMFGTTPQQRLAPVKDALEMPRDGRIGRTARGAAVGATVAAAAAFAVRLVKPRR
jgi:acyl-CoA reductase-like NAD-dependent aldehyde dehydrogenase